MFISVSLSVAFAMNESWIVRSGMESGLDTYDYYPKQG